MFPAQAKAYALNDHYMIDMETVSVDFNRPVVVQIGVTYISSKGNQDPLEILSTFEAKLSINSQIGAGRKIQEETLAWWMKQKNETLQEVFDSENAKDFRKVLIDLQNWFVLHSKQNRKGFIWSNGALTDIVWLRSLYDDYTRMKRGTDPSLSYPFIYTQERCFRTTVFGLKEWVNHSKDTNDTKHDALADAIWQSQILIDMINNNEKVWEEMARIYGPKVRS